MPHTATIKRLPPKDPEAVLDYRFEWAAESNNNGLSNWLREGETITSCELDVPDGLVLDSFSIVDTNTAVVVWLSEGVLDEEYLVRCKITTNKNRTDTRSFILPISNR